MGLMSIYKAIIRNLILLERAESPKRKIVQIFEEAKEWIGVSDITRYRRVILILISFYTNQ
jgi:hypothetical protein